ncbi:MAG TPA: hypothetical protein VF860_11705 [Candidatus Acidoferrales bacterium]
MRACQGLHGIITAFGHPLWSWIADQKMVALLLMGKMSEVVRRCQGRVGSSWRLPPWRNVFSYSICTGII